MITLQDLYLWNQQSRSSSIIFEKKLKADERVTNKNRQLKSGIHSQSLRKGKFN